MELLTKLSTVDTHAFNEVGTIPIDGHSREDSEDVFKLKIELIEKVSNRPALYDTAHCDHKKLPIINKLWQEVACGLILQGKAVDRNWCKKTFKQMRDYYYKQSKKAKGKSGDGAKHYKPWVYFTAMERVLKSTAYQNEETITNMDDESFDSSCDPSTEANPPQITEVDDTVENVPSVPQKVFKKKRNNETGEEILKLLKNSDAEDEAYHFGMTVASKLRRLSPHSNARAQLKINEVLFQEFSFELDKN